MRQRFSTIFALLVGGLILALATYFAAAQSLSDAKLTHSRTAFPLTGAHNLVACTDCHIDYVFKGVATACLSCHADDEPHDGHLGTQCEACHTPESWRLVTFDHAETDYALAGAHALAECIDCHQDNVYAGTRKTCIACHWQDDAHAGKLGTDCGACHSPGWRQDAFDHSASDFPLTGAHAAAACLECHADGIYEDTPTACVDCHRADDAHHGEFGEECGACHSPGWRQATFDHSQTGYPLIGAHALVPCARCHPDAKYVDTPQTCGVCHASDDAHDGRFGTDCGACHSPGWQQATFDHDVTEFPLIGVHAMTVCARCHADSTYEDTPQACVACHRDDDVHDGERGVECQVCHTPAGWP